MALSEPAAFFDTLRTGLQRPTLSPGEVSGCNAILAACEGWPLSWTAYGFATAYHESAHTMQPVKEIGGEAYFHRMYDPEGSRPDVARQLGNTQPGDGARFAGRGYVQLTGRANYARAEHKLSEPLTENPDLAMDPPVAAQVMRYGMQEGWFTGRKLEDFLPDGHGDLARFIRARRIINGQDRAELIADYAVKFQDALIAGGWRS